MTKRRLPYPNSITNWISALPKFVMRHLETRPQVVFVLCITDCFNFVDFNPDTPIHFRSVPKPVSPPHTRHPVPAQHHQCRSKNWIIKNCCSLPRCWSCSCREDWYYCPVLLLDLWDLLLRPAPPRPVSLPPLPFPPFAFMHMRQMCTRSRTSSLVW